MGECDQMPVLQNLKCDHGVLGFLLDLPMDSSFRSSPRNEQSGRRKASNDHGKRQHEFCTESQIVLWALYDKRHLKPSAGSLIYLSVPE